MTEEVISESPEISEAPETQEKKDRITKGKNPGRVAAGRKLAELNKKNKAAKEEEEKGGSIITLSHVIGGVGLVIGLVSLYLQLKPKGEPPVRVVYREPEKKRLPVLE